MPIPPAVHDVLERRGVELEATNFLMMLETLRATNLFLKLQSLRHVPEHDPLIVQRREEVPAHDPLIVQRREEVTAVHRLHEHAHDKALVWLITHE